MRCRESFPSRGNAVGHKTRNEYLQRNTTSEHTADSLPESGNGR
jgi:hypothetical protein